MKKILTVAALLTGSHILAQTVTQQADTTSLNEVVVTANKFPIKTALTGKVVHIINRQDIERSGGRDLAQVLNEQGGIYINGANSSPGKDKSIYSTRWPGGAHINHH
jgi:vitamin B12 transporter